MGKIAKKFTWGRVATLVLLAIAAYVIFQQQRQIITLYQNSVVLQGEAVALRAEIVHTQAVIAEYYISRDEMRVLLQRQEAINTILGQYIDKLLKGKTPKEQPKHQQKERETGPSREDKRQKYNRQQRNGTRQEIV